MLTESQIRQDIAQKKEAFNVSVFTAHTLPEWFMGMFKEAIFATAPTDLKLKADRVRKLIRRQPHTLTNFEVAIMCNTILAVPLVQLNENLDVALDRQEELSNVLMAYKTLEESKDKEWTREFEARMRLIRGVKPAASKLHLP
jgi:hypothetical protein